MKKYKKISILVLLCIGMLSGCGKKKPEDALVGKWESVDRKGESFIFNDDGTYMYTALNGNDATGTYKITDNEMQLTSDASGLGADLNKVSGLHEFTLDGDTLSFPYLGYASIEYTKVK